MTKHAAPVVEQLFALRRPGNHPITTSPITAGQGITRVPFEVERHTTPYETAHQNLDNLVKLRGVDRFDGTDQAVVGERINLVSIQPGLDKTTTVANPLAG